MARSEVSSDCAHILEARNSSSHQTSPISVARDISKLSPSAELSLFSKIAWWSLVVNLGVVAWGVYLRAMEFGDGCGSRWPLCDGNSNPIHGPIARLVELSHRASTGLTVLFAIALIFFGRRWFDRGAQARLFAYVVGGFVALEALVGMLLVKFHLVANNASAERAGVMSFHVVSTFLLMGATAWAAYTGSANRRLVFKGQGAVGWLLALGFAMIAGLGVSGAISALGHTLDPVPDVLREAVKPGTFWMVRLQPYHPYVSLAVGMYLVLIATLISNLRPSAEVRRAGIVMVSAFLVELAIGLVNILMRAPVALQMVHLAAADAAFVSFAYFAATALVAGLVHREQSGPAARRVRFAELVHHYVALTKPRVISLLLFTTLAALLAGARGWPGLWLFVSVSVGGYLMAGAANAINMVVERDLDEAMVRTRTRPTVSEIITTGSALNFAVGSALVAFALLAFGVNLLTACLAFAGLVFYVSVYTLGLKRRTYHNIVIGGAAGAFPPLVGWAASQNGLAPLAYYLFAIVFLWTPVHFWALAILIKDDYASAGVPMLPVVKGVRATTVQIIVYTVLTVAITLVPVLARQVGWTYAAIAAVLNVYLLVLCVRLFRSPERPQASRLFHYSMLYLAILFTAVAVDRSISHPAPANVRVESAAVAEAGGGRWSTFGVPRMADARQARAAQGGF